MPLLSTLPGSIDIFFILRLSQDFPDGSVVKTSPSIARRAGWITSQGANIPHASRPRNQNIKQKQICNKFNKGLKMTFPIKDLVNLFASPCKFLFYHELALQGLWPYTMVYDCITLLCTYPILTDLKWDYIRHMVSSLELISFLLSSIYSQTQSGASSRPRIFKLFI